jgi:hypothetical protein
MLQPAPTRLRLRPSLGRNVPCPGSTPLLRLNPRALHNLPYDPVLFVIIICTPILAGRPKLARRLSRRRLSLSLRSRLSRLTNNAPPSPTHAPCRTSSLSGAVSATPPIHARFSAVDTPTGSLSTRRAGRAVRVDSRGAKDGLARPSGHPVTLAYVGVHVGVGVGSDAAGLR